MLQLFRPNLGLKLLCCLANQQMLKVIEHLISRQNKKHLVFRLFIKFLNKKGMGAFSGTKLNSPYSKGVFQSYFQFFFVNFDDFVGIKLSIFHEFRASNFDKSFVFEILGYIGQAFCTFYCDLKRIWL